MILSWGKPTISWKTSTNGQPASGSWTIIDTPKEDTTQLTSSAGDNVEAKEEGGELVDVMFKKNTYTLEFDIFVKKGKALPWTDTDGIVSGEYAIEITPEDQNCVGIQIDRCTLRAETNYTSADGITVHYTATPLKPASGKMVKLLTNGTAPGTNGVSLSANTATVDENNSVMLTAAASPSSATVVWTSLDTSVATVNAGTVTGIAEGTTAIIASIVVDGVVYSDSCIVTVNANV